MKKTIKQKLQIRFVLLSMAALLLLQGLIVSVSIYNNHADLVKRSDALLEQVRQNPATNVRHFTVTVNAKADHIRPETVHYVSLTREEMTELGQKALETGREKGFLSEYRYHIYTNEKGTRIFFLPRGASLETYRMTATNLIQISAVSLGVMCVLLILVSGWVVTPLIKNHEKQKQFITAASHELRTPLTVISTDAQLLRLEVGESQWIDGILQQVDHLSRMTQNLVMLAKAEEYNNPVVAEPFSLSDEVLEVLDIYAGLWERKGVSLAHTVPEGLAYCGSRKELHQLLCVLLDNAFKHCPQGGTIAVILKQEKHGPCLMVSNTIASAQGLDVEALDQRFYRGSNAAGEGFGLGLSIAQAIAKRHKGNLTVKLPEKEQFLVEVTLR